MLFLAVHHDFQGMLEAHMAYKLSLLDSRHAVEDLFLEHAIACIGVNRKIPDTEGSEVLEEVGTL